jgi:signal transduction histidine kinase
LLGGNTQKTLNEGKLLMQNTPCSGKDGSQFPGEISTAPIRSTAGAPTGFIGITRDITEQKQAVESEKRLTQLKEEFIAGVSYELRTPLLSLMGYLEQLRNGARTDPDLFTELMRRTSLDAFRLLDLANELIDFLLLKVGVFH